MSRTFKVQAERMRGSDVRAWQDTINAQLRRWKAETLLEIDGVYGITTRSFTAKVLYGLGIPQTAMKNGVTPELRVKVRSRRLSSTDRQRYKKRTAFRAALKSRRVAPPLDTVLADSWGYHPPVHDGLDLICPPEATIYAMVDGTVVRADTGGWWGKAPSGDVSKGDGIVIVRCDVNVGPFRKGLNICYGHAEHPQVKVGEKVRAGDSLGRAGLAVAWHVHLMVNDNQDTRGVGDRDPRPFYDYARKNA